MRALGRLICTIVCTAVALQPAVALGVPSPSPALSGILAPPASADYVEADPSVPGIFEGPFDAKTYVNKTGTTNNAAIQQTMERDGFVDGYWRTWVQKASQHVLIEFVIAFNGGDGAKKWLASSELADKADLSYQHPISITGIDAYYGARVFSIANQAYADLFAFVKGNDYFGIIAVSPKDDLGSITANQTMAQYSAAPDATIPQSQWPRRVL